MCWTRCSSRDLARKNAQNRRERVAAAKAKGTHAIIEWELLKAVFGDNVCVRCGTDDYYVQKDHIKPVCQGGCDCIGNLQPLCPKCNSSKGVDDTDWRILRRPDWVNAFNSLLKAVNDAGVY